MIDEKTPHLQFPLPHPSNDLADDVVRLRVALNGIDAKFQALDALLQSDDINLDTLQELVNAIKGDAQALLNHIGVGGSAHAVATTNSPGFMSAADKSALDQHLGAGGSSHAEATETKAGFMSAVDKQKLDGVSLGAPYDAVVVAATTVGQTSFAIPGGYTAGAIEVLLNGIELDSSDYTATNGTNVVLASGVESASSKLKVRRLKQCLRA